MDKEDRYKDILKSVNGSNPTTSTVDDTQPQFSADVMDNLLGTNTNDDNKYKYIVAKEFYNSDNIETDIRAKTDLPNKMVMQIIKLHVFETECARFEVNKELPKVSEIVNEVILDNYYTLRISVGRAGRDEFFRFLTNGAVKPDADIKRRMFGWRR
jgi:hypothetical protein